MKTEVRKLSFYRPAAEIFDHFYQDPAAVFLDSAMVNELGQYSIIGFNPYLTLEERNGVCRRNSQPAADTFEAELGRYLQENYEENTSGLPLCAGAIGYLTYDYGRKFEQIPSRHQSRILLPDASFTFYDNLLIEDCANQILYLTGRGVLGPAGETIAALETRIKEARGSSARMEGGAGQAAFTSDFTEEEYKQAVDRLVDYIVEGDVYIANMTQQLQVKSKKSPYQVFKQLRRQNPAPFGGYFNCGEIQIISASPERFLKVRDKIVETRPIKGTRPRGQSKQEDERLRCELLESDKDKSELLMIVDLLRNDLNRVCVPGSVKVKEHFRIEEYATVFHLVTTIVGELCPACGITGLLAAAFPGGSITGAPKIRAMEIIDELERASRGLYTGSMGYLGLDGACDLNIVIRTAVHRQGIYHLGVGGGITCESERDFEYEETLQKARALLEVLDDGTNSAG